MSFGGGHKDGLGGLFGKESATSYEVYLNLTPLMDVMSNILFFLLAAFGSTLVAILPTTVPLRTADVSPTIEAKEDKVTVTLRVDATSLLMALDSPTLPPEQLRALGAQLGRVTVTNARTGEKLEQYDYAGLTAALKRVKERYPASQTMVLVPNDDIIYETVVEIMDAARDYQLPSGHKMVLFDEVVMSSTPASESKKK